MARLFATSINLNKNELQNARIQNLSSNPSSPVAGQIYFNNVENELRVYDGSQWVGSGSIEYGNTASRPAASKAGLVYADTETGTLYLDTGTSWIQIGANAQDITNAIDNINTDDIEEGSSNKYFTDERAQDAAGLALEAGTQTGITVSYDDASNAVDFVVADQFLSHTTSDLAEGSNLYFTNQRAIDANTGLWDTIGSAATAQANAEDYADNAVDSHNNLTTGVHGVTGNVVGTSDSQTLTNKVLGSSTSLGANLDAATFNIINLGAPQNGSDAATKSYVDAVSEGLHIHQAASVYVASNVNIATALEAGQIIDGVTLTAGMRVLVNGQTNQSENGIYKIETSGAPSRALDFDTALEVASGDFIFVSLGNNYANTGWVQTLSPATIGTDPISFTQFSGAGTYTAGSGLDLDGTEFSVQLDSDSLEITGNGLKVNYRTDSGIDNDNGLYVKLGTGLVFDGSGQITNDTASGYGVRKFAQNVGNNSATSFTINHNLSTKDVTVQIFENGSTHAQIEADVEHTSTSVVTVKFASAPTTDEYRVVVIG